MKEQVHVSEQASADLPELNEIQGSNSRELSLDIAYKRLAIVNVVFYGKPGAADREWVLIDTGVVGTKGMILRAAKERFGENSRPCAIIMTHGHFDHIGALEDLAELWDVPVYAHSLEAPFLDGRASYPPADPSVGGGMMSSLSRFYPRGPVNVGDYLQLLSPDQMVPGMPGWRWIHTPGHTVGHVSLWREEDRMLIAGDAFITTRQESAYAVAVQKPELHGPPMYYTQDWNESRCSLETLAALEPDLVVTGHGAPLAGEEMRRALHELANRFDEVAVPHQGEYVEHPAGIGSGREYTHPMH